MVLYSSAVSRPVQTGRREVNGVIGPGCKYCPGTGKEGDHEVVMAPLEELVASDGLTAKIPSDLYLYCFCAEAENGENRGKWRKR